MPKTVSQQLNAGSIIAILRIYYEFTVIMLVLFEMSILCQNSLKSSLEDSGRVRHAARIVPKLTNVSIIISCQLP
jgi:hypothetical protein